MSAPWRLLFAASLGAWIGVLALGILTLRLVMGRQGRAAAWPFVSDFAPLMDLVGTWAGTLAALALLFGRVGYGLAWAGALGLLAVMLVASLYDRAVLMPSLEAASKRAGHDPKWEEDWRFLWRMAGWGRALTLGMGLVALPAGLLA